MTDTRKGVLAKVTEVEPLLTRGAIVSVVGVIGMVLNHHFADGTAQYIADIVLSAFGLLTAILTRHKVTPVVPGEVVSATTVIGTTAVTTDEGSDA